VPLHVDAASGGFVWPFLYPHSEWDFRLEQVRSINVSGHKFGLVYPGIGWLVFREKTDLPEDLVFYENYLGKRDATFTLNFSTGSAMVLAQVLQLRALRPRRLPLRHGDDAVQRASARERGRRLRRIRIDRDRGRGAAPAGGVQTHRRPQLRRVRRRLAVAAERGWMVPAYTLPPNAEHVKIMRALVKQTLGHSLVKTLGNDIVEACETLKVKGKPAPRRP